MAMVGPRSEQPFSYAMVATALRRNIIRQRLSTEMYYNGPSSLQGRIQSPLNDNGVLMKLLNTYEDRDEAEAAAGELNGEKRLASERDATVVIYNLFGIPSWGNFHRLNMYNLGELKGLLDRRNAWQTGEQERHAEILSMLKTVAKRYDIQIPAHWS